MIVMPILGFGYLITMVGPDQTTTPWGYTAFQIVRSVVLSTQVRHIPEIPHIPSIPLARV